MLAWWLAIVGGSPSATDRWPDAVAVFGVDGDTCTGTLIAPDWVLTAGHCVRVSHVVVGSNDWSTGERVEAVDQITHDDYSVLFDVSLVQLEHPVDLPVREMVHGCLADFYVDGPPMTVAGFGRLDLQATENTTLLHEVQVPVVDADCSDSARGCRNLVGPGGELLAGGGGIDSCAGDSGGPLYVEADGRAWLAGVVSRSALPFDTPCGDGGIYTRTDAILPWIEASTGLTFDPPDCSTVNLPPAATADVHALPQGGRIELEVDVVDDGDSTTLSVLEPPLQGRLDGLVYVAAPFQLGKDRVVLAVTDDGQPARTSQVTVEFEILPAGVLEEAEPGGCSSTGGLFGGLLLLPLLYRRVR